MLRKYPLSLGSSSAEPDRPGSPPGVSLDPRSAAARIASQGRRVSAKPAYDPARPLLAGAVVQRRAFRDGYHVTETGQTGGEALRRPARGRRNVAAQQEESRATHARVSCRPDDR